MNTSTAGEPVADTGGQRQAALASYALLVPFFLSGSAALIAQLAWLRVMTVSIGGSSAALNIVLITFMGGLAIGAHVVKVLRPRPFRDYVLLYVALETVLSVYIFFSKPIIELTAAGFTSVIPRLGHETLLENALRLIVVGSSLLVPTIAMGMTTPILIAATVRRLRDTAATTGLLYGMNTLGAAVGSLFATGYLILTFGVARSLRIAAGFNAVAALLALGIALFLRSSPGSGDVVAIATDGDERIASVPTDRRTRTLCVLAAAGGFLGMTLEVVFARLLSFVIGSSYYSKAIAISGFLLGIVIGSLVVGWLARRVPLRAAGIPALLAAFGVVTVLSALAFEVLPQWLDQLFHSALFSSFPVVTLKLIATISIVSLPAMMSGMLLPYLVQMLTDRTGDVRGSASSVLFWNTIGSVLGVAVTGYLLIEWIGVRMTLYVTATAIFGMAIFAMMAMTALVDRKAKPARIALAVTSVGLLISVGLVLVRGNRPLVLDTLVYQKLEGAELLRYDEDEIASVTAINFPDRGDSKGLLINGLLTGQGDERQMVQDIIPHVAMLTHGSPEHFFFAGVGSGRTAGAAGLYPNLSVDAVEISAAVIRTLPVFGSFNMNVAENPDVAIIHGDARHYLRRTSQRYDLIAPDVYISAATGTAYLYNQEFFELCAQRLRPGGRVVLNIYLKESPIDQVIAAGFLRALPYVDLIEVPYANYSFLIGANEPIEYPIRPWDAWAGHPALEEVQRQLGVAPEESLAPFVLMKRDRMLELLAHVEPSTDDRPIVDYIHLSAPGDAWRW